MIHTCKQWKIRQRIVHNNISCKCMFSSLDVKTCTNRSQESSLSDIPGFVIHILTLTATWGQQSLRNYILFTVQFYIYTLSWKWHFHHNFGKCKPIFKILSLSIPSETIHVSYDKHFHVNSPMLLHYTLWNSKIKITTVHWLLQSTVLCLRKT